MLDLFVDILQAACVGFLMQREVSRLLKKARARRQRETEIGRRLADD